MTTTDIELAFAHPEDRAEASASADPRDRFMFPPAVWADDPYLPADIDL